MANWARITTWSSGQILTASALNGEFNNVINNSIPASIDDYSADAATAKIQTSPGTFASPSLATSLAGELERIRYQIAQLAQGANLSWLDTPVIPTPIGTILAYAAESAPTGFLICDGSLVSRTTYANLFAVVKTRFGRGNGSTTFKLPDLRGQFLRGGPTVLNFPGYTDVGGRTEGGTPDFTLTGSTANGSPNIVVSSTTNLSPGMEVQGTNIPGGSVVRSITDTTTFVLGDNVNTASVNATGTGAGITFTFSDGATANYIGSYEAAGTGTSGLSADQSGHTHTVPGLSIPALNVDIPVYAEAGAGTSRVDEAKTAAAVAATITVTTATGTTGTGTSGSTDPVITLASTAAETRPVNVFVNFIIRF